MSVTLENPKEKQSVKKDTRQNIVKLIRKWGETNTDGLLDPSCQFYSTPAIEGIIGYRIESNNAVVFGDPLCAPENMGGLALAFQKHCEEQKLGVVYTIVSEEFANWGHQHLSGALVEFGEKFVLNPQDNPMDHTGSKAVLVRKKVKHALKDGATVHEYLGDDPKVRKEIEQVAQGWLKGRQGPQIYLSHVHLFDDQYGKRWFYALQNGHVVGFLVINQIQAHQGWLLNHVMWSKEAAHGTSELLVISVLEALQKEGSKLVLIGPVPAKQLGKISGLNPVISTLVRGLYKAARILFHLKGHETFWEKFQPTVKRSYLMFPKGNLTFSSISALFRAFNVGS